MKTLIVFGMILGSYVGSYLPVLWGASVFSISSVLLGAVGALAGIGLAFKLATKFGMD